MTRKDRIPPTPLPGHRARRSPLPTARPNGRAADRRANPIISLLTDFGQQDSFVGQVKGVILGIARHAQIVDLSHLVPAQDVRSAALLLETAYGAFPPGAIHLCVVDPGVGSDRLALVARAGGQLFVVPDNGLLTRVLEREPGFSVRSIAHPLLRRDTLSSTFHGRDLFAVAAAQLAAGFPLYRVGPLVEHPVLLDLPRARFVNGSIHGEILRIDHFGNAASNITAADLQQLPGPIQIHCGGIAFGPLRQRYSEVSPGSPLALLDSSGRLEVAVNCGSATTLGICPGSPVEVGMI